MRNKKSKFIVLNILSMLFSSAMTYLILYKKMNSSVSSSKNKENKFKQYYHLANQWLLIRNQGKKITDFFNSHGYENIAIYGMGELGNRLYEELRNSNIKIKYVIDRYPENNYSDLEFRELNCNLEPVDVIIVTPVFDYENIEKEITTYVDYSILSLEDVLFQL